MGQGSQAGSTSASSSPGSAMEQPQFWQPSPPRPQWALGKVGLQGQKCLPHHQGTGPVVQSCASQWHLQPSSCLTHTPTLNVENHRANPSDHCQPLAAALCLCGRPGEWRSATPAAGSGSPRVRPFCAVSSSLVVWGLPSCPSSHWPADTTYPDSECGGAISRLQGLHCEQELSQGLRVWPKHVGPQTRESLLGGPQSS